MTNYRRGLIKKLLAGSAAASLATPMLAQAKEEKKVRLKMQTYWGKEVGDVFKIFSENIKVASDKSVRVKVYESSSVVPDADLIEAVSKGTLDMCWSYAGYWPGKIDLAIIESGLAGTWTNVDEADYIFKNSLNPLLKESYAEQNIHHLGNAYGGSYDLLTTKPIKSLDDLKNMKIRATPSVAKILQQFDIPTVFMPASELYVGLSTGSIDGVIYGGPIEYTNMKLFEVAKHYTELDMIDPGFTDSILINKDTWDSLTPANQKILELAVADTADQLHEWMMQGTFDPKYSGNFIFNSLTPEDSKRLREVAKELWKEEAEKSSRNRKAIDFLMGMSKE